MPPARGFTLRLLLIASGSGCGPAPAEPVTAEASAAAPVASAPARAVPSPAAPKNDPSVEAASDDPAQLVRKVFQALRTEDAVAYAASTVSTDEDHAALASITSHAGPRPSAAERTKIAARHGEALHRFVGELAARGIAVRSMTLGEIDTSRAKREGSRGFAEDLTFMVRSGETQVRVTIDDCLLAPRGWIIVDGLKLRKQP